MTRDDVKGVWRPEKVHFLTALAGKEEKKRTSGTRCERHITGWMRSVGARVEDVMNYECVCVVFHA